MSSVWFFGDSYTECHGTRKGDPFYDENKKTFIEIVADKLNYTPVNKAIAGASNEWIVHSVLTHSRDMKPNDIVVISDTLPWGFIQYYKKRKQIVSINDYYIKENEWLYNSKEEKKAIDRYVDIRKKYNKHFTEFYYEDYKNLIYLLKHKGVKACFWSYKLWWDGKLEKIEDATNGEIDDFHFSYKGHEELAKLILYKIKVKSLI